MSFKEILSVNFMPECGRCECKALRGRGLNRFVEGHDEGRKKKEVTVRPQFLNGADIS
jgi:hypothetical protein